MTSETNKKKPGILNQIIVGAVLALLVGGTSPWWWTEIFGNKTETKSTSTEIWKEGKLSISLNNFSSGVVADLDGGKLLRLGTSISAAGADLSIRQSVHGIVFEPGLSKGDGVSFDARFIAVHDNTVGKDGCSASLISTEFSNHLQLSTDIDIGSHICMVTTDGRIAEFSILKLNLNASPRNVEIKYVVWVKS